MKVLLQRVKKASVVVNGQTVSEIGHGLLALVCIEKNDTQHEAEYLANKTANLRIFEDENQKMNLSVKDIQGEVLAVSQFTLAADTTRGNRPGFEAAAHPETANQLYEYYSQCLRHQSLPVKNGIFQAYMEVALINDGPVTILLEKKS